METREFDYVIVNERTAAEPVLKRYAETEAGPVEVDRTALEAMGVEVLSVDLLASGDVVQTGSGGELTVTSTPGSTTFRAVLPGTAHDEGSRTSD